MRRAARYALAVLFIGAGVLHFVKTPFYVRIMPDALAPYALPLVYFSGLCEIAGGIGLLLARVRRAAALGLIALLVAVFPANLQMALHPNLFADMASPPALHLRLPLQIVLIAWVWWCR